MLVCNASRENADGEVALRKLTGREDLRGLH